MSLEKCFAVYFPLKSKTVCTLKTSKWATGIMGVLLAGYNSLNFLVMDSHFIESYGFQVCVVLNDYRAIAQRIDSALYSFAPSLLMFTTNLAIVIKFMKAKCRSTSTEFTNQALAKSATRGTAMVVTVSVTFLILTAPTAVDQALWHNIQLSNNTMYWVFMNFTQYLNHSINGVLYIIVGSRFRNELFKIICRKKRSHGVSHFYSVTNRRNNIVNGISRTRF